MTNSGEKQIRPDFSLLHFFAACFMNCILFLFTFLIFDCTASLFLPSEWASPSFLISQCCRRFSSRFSVYFLTTCGRRVLSHLDAACRSLGGPGPTNEAVCRSTIKSLWSPIPYPAGIMHALATVTSGVVHIPSIGSWPRKYVGPIFFPVYLPTASIIPKPSGLVSILPIACM